MKKLIIFLIIILLTGCESDYQINCYLHSTNDGSIEEGTMVGSFIDNNLVKIENRGTSICNDLENANYVYEYMEESFKNVDLEGINTTLEIKNNTLIYSINYDIKKMSKDDIKYALGDYGISSNFFKKYASLKGYICD